MRRIPLVAAAALLVLAAPAGAAEQGPYPETEAALDAEYAKLKWIEEPGSYDLPLSGSSAAFASGRSMLVGFDAERILFLMNGREFPETEAVLYDDDSGVFVTFEYFDEGYVKDEDWTDVDPAAFLESIREGTEAGNKERAKYGIAPMHVRGWLAEPAYDSGGNTVTWAIEFDDGDGVTVNATALKLGRYGYEQLTWVGSGEQYGQLGGLLNTALGDHAFNEGHRYADFQDGDKVAAYGLAALVAAVAGAKLGKGIIAAIIAFGLILLKKGWIVIVLALAGIGAAVKRFVSGRRQPTPDSGAE
ncbi:MAG: DUF2167 domain-containing protein [Alphaproteobacteria bacterium]|nr:DUF2167 domain-containing protein [Alphaproteobacteria bacterium]